MSKGLSDWAQGVADAASWISQQGHTDLAKRMLAGGLKVPDSGTEDRIVAQIEQWVREQGFGTKTDRGVYDRIAVGIRSRDWSLK